MVVCSHISIQLVTLMFGAGTYSVVVVATITTLRFEFANHFGLTIHFGLTSQPMIEIFWRYPFTTPRAFLPYNHNCLLSPARQLSIHNLSHNIKVVNGVKNPYDRLR